MNSKVAETKKMKLLESFKIVLQSRGALGLQIFCKMDNDAIVEIKRLEPVIITTVPVIAGDPIDAVFEIKSVNKGKVKITFYETQPWNKEFQPIIQKEIDVEVSD